MAWSIKRDGTQLTIRSEGKKTVRTFVTEAQAIAAHDKLVAEHAAELAQARKARKAAPSDLRHPELEQVIIDAPEDPASYAPFADWLQTHGDPRGTLMALQLAKRTDDIDRAIARELQSNRAYLLGALAPQQKWEVFGWEFGFIHRVTTSRVEGARSEDILEQLLQHPSGRYLTEVSLGDYSDVVRATPEVAVFGRAVPVAMRSLYINGERTLALDHLWPAMPRLRSLTLHGPEVRSLELPALAELRLAHGALTVATLQLVPSVSPQLRELGLAADVLPIDAVLSVLSRAELPKLEWLYVRGANDVDRLLRELPELPFAAQLVRLELEHMGMTDAQAIELARHRDRFPRLTWLSLDFNRLTDRGIAAIDGFAKTVTTSLQDADRDRVVVACRVRDEL